MSSTPAMQSALEQMKSLAAQAGAPSAGRRVDTTVGQGGFADALQSSLERINHLQQTSKASSRAFQAGQPGVSLNDVMVDMQKASVAFEMGTQVRNRMVSAYKDVMNMQV